MIVSHRHRFIFVAIPRTGTHSLRRALRPHLGPHDWEQCGLFEKKAFPIAELARLGDGHITCEELRPYLLPEMWDGYFKFGVVRNPYDRFVSQCFFLARDVARFGDAPLPGMKRILADRARARFLRPQADHVVDAHGGLSVDRILRFERLDADVRAACERLRIPVTGLTRENAAAHPPWQECLDDELRALLAERYRRDFLLFDYSP